MPGVGVLPCCCANPCAGCVDPPGTPPTITATVAGVNAAACGCTAHTTAGTSYLVNSLTVDGVHTLSQCTACWPFSFANPCLWQKDPIGSITVHYFANPTCAGAPTIVTTDVFLNLLLSGGNWILGMQQKNLFPQPKVVFSGVTALVTDCFTGFVIASGNTCAYGPGSFEYNTNGGGTVTIAMP